MAVYGIFVARNRVVSVEKKADCAVRFGELPISGELRWWGFHFPFAVVPIRQRTLFGQRCTLNEGGDDYGLVLIFQQLIDRAGCIGLRLSFLD